MGMQHLPDEEGRENIHMLLVKIFMGSWAVASGNIKVTHPNPAVLQTRIPTYGSSSYVSVAYMEPPWNRCPRPSGGAVELIVDAVIFLQRARGWRWMGSRGPWEPINIVLNYLVNGLTNNTTWIINSNCSSSGVELHDNYALLDVFKGLVSDGWDPRISAYYLQPLQA
jgi:hypothetical protein